MCVYVRALTDKRFINAWFQLANVKPGEWLVDISLGVGYFVKLNLNLTIISAIANRSVHISWRWPNVRIRADLPLSAVRSAKLQVCCSNPCWPLSRIAVQCKGTSFAFLCCQLHIGDNMNWSNSCAKMIVFRDFKVSLDSRIWMNAHLAQQCLDK